MIEFSGQKFAVLSGDASTADALGMLALGQRLDEVQKRLVAIAQQVDVLLLDMPPSQALGFQQMLAAGDWLLVPTKMERLAIEGVGQMLSLAMTQRIRLMGVVPTMVQNVIEHREQGNELLEVLKRNVDAGTATWLSGTAQNPNTITTKQKYEQQRVRANLDVPAYVKAALERIAAEEKTSLSQVGAFLLAWAVKEYCRGNNSAHLHDLIYEAKIYSPSPRCEYRLEIPGEQAWLESA